MDTPQHTLLYLRARTSATFADLQVAVMRDLAARLKAGGAPAGHTVRVQAAADQLEAAARETWRALGSWQTHRL